MAAATVARGDYVCVLDSDDQLTPRFVEVMLHQLETHPECDAVGCDAHLFTDDDDQPYGRGYLHSVRAKVPGPDGDVLTVEDVLAGRVPYYTSIIRRAAWEAVGGYEPGIDGIDESVLIWLRLTSNFCVRLIPDRLARYRVREDSLSRDPEKVEAFEKALIRTFELFAEKSSDPRHVRIVQGPIRRLRYHQALRRARWAFAEGDMRHALRFARAAFSQRPTPRAAAVVILLKIAPRALKHAYPLKQWLTRAARRARQRILL
jgi:glycosyltransferase involved in cell wall biosynthesis